MSKALYRPLGMAASVAGGLLAGAVFKRLWGVLRHEESPPEATQRHRTWREVLAAAALQGAIFGLVKAAVDRGTATGVERATGQWPGED